MSRRMAAEYGDDVSKLNRKEDELLKHKLRNFTRQEKVVESTLKWSISNVEKFKLSIERHNHNHMPNLKDLDRHCEIIKASSRRHGGTYTGRRAAATHLPGLRPKRSNAQETRLFPLTDPLPPPGSVGGWRAGGGKPLIGRFTVPPVPASRVQVNKPPASVPDYSYHLRRFELIMQKVHDGDRA